MTGSHPTGDSPPGGAVTGGPGDTAPAPDAAAVPARDDAGSRGTEATGTAATAVGNPPRGRSASTPSRRGWRRLRRRESVAGLLFISPWVIGFLLFTVISMGWSLLLSFQHYDLSTNTGTRAGLGNYRLLFDDPGVGNALRNTFWLAAVTVPLNMVVGLALALLLNSIKRFSGLIRTIFYLPKVMPTVATASVFLILLNGNSGAINRLLGLFHIHGPMWLIDPHWVKPAMVVMGLWGAGGSMVILLAALQSVPTELYEAAMTDGANPWQRLVHITLPMISPTLFFLVITHTIGALQVFDGPFLLFNQQGGAPQAASFYGVYLYSQAFQQFNFGEAAAMAWLLFFIILAITAVQMVVGNRLVHYGGGGPND